MARPFRLSRAVGLILAALVVAAVAGPAGHARVLRTGQDRALEPQEQRFRSKSKGAVLDAGARLLSSLLGGFNFNFPDLSGLLQQQEEQEQEAAAAAKADADEEEDSSDEDQGDEGDDKGDQDDAEDGDKDSSDADAPDAPEGAEGAEGAGGPDVELPEVKAAEDAGEPCVGEGAAKRCGKTPEEAAEKAAEALATSDETDILSLAAGTGSSKGAGATAAALASGAGMGALDRAASMDKAKKEGGLPSLAEEGEKAEAAGEAGSAGGAGAASRKDASGGSAPSGESGDGAAGDGAPSGRSEASDEAGESAPGDDDGKPSQGGPADAADATEAGGASSGQAEAGSGDAGAEDTAGAPGTAHRRNTTAAAAEHEEKVAQAAARGPPAEAFATLAEKVADEFHAAQRALQAAIGNVTGEWGLAVDTRDDDAIRKCARARSAGPRIAEAEARRRALLAAARAQTAAALGAKEPAEAATMLTASHEASSGAASAHALAVGLAANATAWDAACEAAVNASRARRVETLRLAHGAVVAATIRIRQASRRAALAARALERHTAEGVSEKQVQAYTRLVEAEKDFVALLEGVREDFQGSFDAWNASFARPFTVAHTEPAHAEEEAEGAVEEVTGREERGELADEVSERIGALEAEGSALGDVRASVKGEEDEEDEEAEEAVKGEEDEEDEEDGKGEEAEEDGKGEEDEADGKGEEDEADGKGEEAEAASPKEADGLPAGEVTAGDEPAEEADAEQE